MIRVKLAALSAAAVVVLLTACGGDDNGKATAGAGELPQGSEPVELDPASFTEVLTLGVSGGGGREELVKVERVGMQAARAAGEAPLGERYP